MESSNMLTSLKFWSTCAHIPFSNMPLHIVQAVSFCTHEGISLCLWQFIPVKPSVKFSPKPGWCKHKSHPLGNKHHQQNICQHFIYLTCIAPSTHLLCQVSNNPSKRSKPMVVLGNFDMLLDVVPFSVAWPWMSTRFHQTMSWVHASVCNPSSAHTDRSSARQLAPRQGRGKVKHLFDQILGVLLQNTRQFFPTKIPGITMVPSSSGTPIFSSSKNWCWILQYPARKRFTVNFSLTFYEKST